MEGNICAAAVNPYMYFNVFSCLVNPFCFQDMKAAIAVKVAGLPSAASCELPSSLAMHLSIARSRSTIAARGRRWIGLFATLLLVAASCSVDADSATGASTTPADTQSSPDTSSGAASDSAASDSGAADSEASDSGDSDSAASDGGSTAGGNASTASPGSDGVGDDYYPTYGNGGYDVASYDLAIDWDDDNRTIDSVATIALTPTQNLSRFNLDLIGFEVTSIEVNGIAATFERDGRELIITPANPLDLDILVEVAIAYNGRPTLLESIGAPFSTGWNDFGDTVVVAGEPEGSAGWYPVNGHPIDKACLLYTSPSPRDATLSRMPSSA